jgi:hypothetical protein
VRLGGFGFTGQAAGVVVVAIFDAADRFPFTSCVVA